MKLPFALLLALAATFCAAQTEPKQSHWLVQKSGTEVLTFRGVSAVNSRVAWASGTQGTWLRTTDGGATWQHGTVAGAEELDFRDVIAFDANTALLLSSGPGDRSRIYFTKDGGQHWQEQFRASGNSFLDCMVAWSPTDALAVGDPVNG